MASGSPPDVKGCPVHHRSLVLLSRRAGCHESGSSSSTEARRSKAKRVLFVNPGVLSDVQWAWATEKHRGLKCPRL